MACSKYEYVKKFEQSDTLLPKSYIVVRVDGKGFTKFTDRHKYAKPNDLRGISLMNRCAEKVMESFSEIWIAYGQSDEYSFVFRRDAGLFQRRQQKIVSCVVSCFSASFVFYFTQFFPGHQLQDVPMFDGRCVLYPTTQALRDYLSWRQVDCHINNLYNTCFWALVLQGGKSNQEAEKILKDTFSEQKHEILFSQFGVNYNNIEEVYKKGSIVIRVAVDVADRKDKEALLQMVNQRVQGSEKKEENEVVQKKQQQQQEEIQKQIKQEQKGEYQAAQLASQKEEGEGKEEAKESKGNGKDERGKKKKKQKKVEVEEEDCDSQEQKEKKTKKVVTVVHEDLIKDAFWEKYRDCLCLCDM